MKKILTLVLLLTIGMGVATAQQKKEAKKNRATVTFVTDLDCESCAKKVLDVIPFRKGVKDVVVDVAKRTVEVTYDPRKTDEKSLIDALGKIDVHVVKDGEKPHNHSGHDHAGHKH